jgi:hypothetical protein
MKGSGNEVQGRRLCDNSADSAISAVTPEKLKEAIRRFWEEERGER